MYRKKIKCLLAAAVAVFFVGCGDGEAVHTSTELSEAEETLSGDEEAADGEEEVPADEAEDGDAGEEPSGAGESTESVTGGSFMAPAEMDETLRTQLTEELLQENEMDTSVVESAPVTKGCTFTLPEAFSESEDIEGMYVTRRYPIDASTIYYVALGRDVALQLMTEETFKAQAEENFRKEYGEEIEVNIDSFESIRIDGCPAFRILCHYQVGDTQISQLEYAINADKSYVITYSQTSDYDRMEEYEASAETIHLVF